MTPHLLEAAVVNIFTESFHNCLVPKTPREFHMVYGATYQLISNNQPYAVVYLGVETKYINWKHSWIVCFSTGLWH